MIDILLLALATSIPLANTTEETIVLRNGQSAVLSKFSKPEFEDWFTNSTLTFVSPSKEESVAMEDIFISPVKSSIRVKMKVKIGGKVSPIPVDSRDIVLLDE